MRRNAVKVFPSAWGWAVLCDDSERKNRSIQARKSNCLLKVRLFIAEFTDLPPESGWRDNQRHLDV